MIFKENNLKASNGVKLLIITQKVDVNDDILGFFHGWLEKFAKKFSKLTVICLEKGEYVLPQNVEVLSLGKEAGKSRLKYIFRFYKYIFKYRDDYDAVFVHMNPEYVVLGGLFWKIMRKKILLWYNHTYGGLFAKLGIIFADMVLHTSPYAFSANTKQSVRMPAGIDTEIFKKNPAAEKLKNSILYIGRFSPVKNIHILIEAAKILDKQNLDFSVYLYGKPPATHIGYFKLIKESARELEKKGKLFFNESAPNFKTPEIYNKHIVSVNLTPSGNYDKTVLESMACETLVLVSSKAFEDALPKEFIFKENDADDLAKKLQSVFKLPEDERILFGQNFRRYIIENHNLNLLAEKISSAVAVPI